MTGQTGANEGSLNGVWLDFYALLEVARDCDATALRQRIGACYAEASNNCDHRDLERRHFYQAMVERVLPQCRRVLLNPETRARYDAQHALHEQGSPDALPYVAFMAGLTGAPLKPTAPVAQTAPAPVEPSAAPTPQPAAHSAAAPPAAPLQPGAWELDFDALPERVRAEVDLAREVVQALEGGFSFDALPSRVAASNGAPSGVAPSGVAPSGVAPVSPASAASTALPIAPPAATLQTHAAPEAPQAQRPFKRNSWDSDAKLPRQRPIAGEIVGAKGENGLVQDKVSFNAEQSRAQRQAARQGQNAYKSRVLLDDRTAAHGDGRRRTASGASARLLSGTARLLLTAIVAALMIIMIQRDNSAPVMADAPTRAAHGWNQSARLPLPGGAALVMERRPAHAYLPQFDRRLTLLSGGKPVAQTLVTMDSGGYTRAEIYRVSPSKLLVFDLWDVYAVDLARRTITPQDLPPARQNEFLRRFPRLGKFDQIGARWSFVRSG